MSLCLQIYFKVDVSPTAKTAYKPQHDNVISQVIFNILKYAVLHEIMLDGPLIKLLVQALPVKG